MSFGMQNLLEFLHKFSHWLLFLFLEITSLILLVSYNGYQSSVWFSSANTIAGVFLEWNSVFTNFFSQAKINEELTSTNLELMQENEYLREALESAKIKQQEISIPYKFISAKVISNSLYDRNNLITINKGSADGVEEDMGVVDGNGVVGIVYLVSDHYSVLMSVLNSHTRISCFIKKRGYFGYLMWDGKAVDEADLNDVPRNARFALGDQVVTSGYSSIFPKGLPVGNIVKAHNSSDGLSYRLRIKLSANFSNLRDVRVIDNKAVKERFRLQKLATDSLAIM